MTVAPSTGVKGNKGHSPTLHVSADLLQAAGWESGLQFSQALMLAIFFLFSLPFLLLASRGSQLSLTGLLFLCQVCTESA